MEDKDRAAAVPGSLDRATVARQWRDTPAGRAWAKKFGATWGGRDGLIAKATTMGKVA